MKKIVASILLSLLLLSCGESRGKKAPDSKRIELDSTSQYYDQNYKVYTLEECEYIVVGGGHSRWGAHKGNCKNHTSYKSDSIQILKEEIDRIKKYIIQLEEENKMMGSELGWREFNKK
jgi:hypothetical protein